LGKEIALTLALHGADIIIHYNRSHEEAEDVAQTIREMGRKCHITSHNLKKSKETGEWFSQLIQKHGCPDILVNSASDYSENTYRNMDMGSLIDSMSIHVYSPLVMIRMMYKTVKNGSIINILDTRVVDRDPIHASYHLGKRGLLTITRDLAVEFAPEMRINAVAPGIILPPEGKGDEWIDHMKKTNPLQERGTAEDISDAVLFLSSARFTTGQIIFIDGGRYLKGNAYGL